MEQLFLVVPADSGRADRHAPGRSRRRRRLGTLVAVVLALAVGLAACSAPDSARPRPVATSVVPVAGGTATFTEQPGSPPNDIFPFMSGADFTDANAFQFQTLLYEPLYRFGAGGRPGLDEAGSLAEAPVYSDGDRVVTIRLKSWRWSDGEAVDARDVVFWMNLLEAEKQNWASYVPGGFPDNVASYRVLSPSVVQFRLKRAYDPAWFTDNELSQITPLPLAWDRTSLRSPPPRRAEPGLPDTTVAGARRVYAFLEGQAQSLSTYATSPIWSVVDGPWRLASFAPSGLAVFVPNRSYSGPDRPHLSRFVELPVASSTSELDLLLAGTSSAGSVPGGRVSVGWVPAEDVPDLAALRRAGYRTVREVLWQFNYLEPNFDNPTAGPIFAQLYVRQAFQHLIDETGWIRAYDHGLAEPTYGPIPAVPRNPWSDPSASVDPDPFDPAAAASLLAAHGWAAGPGGVRTCRRPGAGASDCGAGVPRGARLSFTLAYPTGSQSVALSVQDLQASAARAGVALTLRAESNAEISATIEPCPRGPSCSWQLGDYGGGWIYSPDHLPTGEEIFATGALGNVGSYTSATVDRLIAATTTASGPSEQAALDRYQNAVRRLLPVFWIPSPDTLLAVANGLAGVHPNAYGEVNPQDWYFTRRVASRS